MLKKLLLITALFGQNQICSMDGQPSKEITGFTIDSVTCATCNKTFSYIEWKKHDGCKAKKKVDEAKEKLAKKIIAKK